MAHQTPLREKNISYRPLFFRLVPEGSGPSCHVIFVFFFYIFSLRVRSDRGNRAIVPPVGVEDHSDTEQERLLGWV